MTGKPIPTAELGTSHSLFEVRDEHGQLHAIHHRRDCRDQPKRMWWELADGTVGLGGRAVSELPLYRSETIQGVPQDAWVWMVEGERAADAIAATGRFAVATVTGAHGTPGDSSFVPLRGRQVVLWPDNDVVGRAHMSRVGSKLQQHASEVVVAEWPGAPEHGDAWDFLRVHPAEDLLGVLERARQLAVPSTSAQAGGGPPGVILMAISEVESEPVSWLWQGRIPRGKLTIVDGDPGLGKTTVLLDVAARVSRGAAMPGDEVGSSAASVIILTAEDGLADTIRPRLEAARAELEHVFAVSAIDDGSGERLLSIPEDVARLEETVEQQNAALLVLDPLAAYVSDGVNMNRDQDVRRALAPLARIAERTGVAVVAIRHLRKAGAEQPMYRGGGSIAIIGAARLGMIVARDPNDESRRVLAVTKSNLGLHAPALAFRLVADKDTAASRVEWDGIVDVTAAQLLAVPEEDGGQLAEAKAFLLDLLGDAPQPSKVVYGEARRAGISERTVTRAKKALDIRPMREGFGAGGRWVWALRSSPPKARIDGHAQELATNGSMWPPFASGEIGTIGDQ